MSRDSQGLSYLDSIKKQLTESAEVKKAFVRSGAEQVVAAARLLIDAVLQGNKILLCGNGGSAADSQHLAAELVARLKAERRALPALALTTNTSTLTALANDYDFSRIFVRQLEAFGQAGDILIGISTSGNSENVIKAVQWATAHDLKTVVLTGDGGRLAQLADVAVRVPSSNTQHIQEIHITVGHILCDLIEQAVVGQN